MRVIIVDDEPVYLKEIKRLLLLYAGQMNMHIEIVGEYFSGEQAVNALKFEQTDVIMTDIRMARMDGLELARHIRERSPRCQVVVISGYSDFNYAREAMRIDVAEYLLKPVDPEEFFGMMDVLVERFHDRVFMERKELLYTCIQGERCITGDDQTDLNLLKDDLFGMIAVQNPDLSFGGLLPKDPMIEADLFQCVKEILHHNDIWVYRSGDSKEYIVLFSKTELDEDTWWTLSQEIISKVSDEMTFVSLTYSKGWCTVHQLRDKFLQLKRMLNQYVTIGHSKIVCLEDGNLHSASTFGSFFFQTNQEKTIMELIKRHNWEVLKLEIGNLMQYWESERCPAYRMKQYLTQLCHLIARTIDKPEDSPMEREHIELRIEEIVYTATSLDEVFQVYWNMLEVVFEWIDKEEVISDQNHQIFRSIIVYLQEHLHETITLKRLTDQFYISRTVLCNLFREQAGCSFVEYLTNLRIDKAKALILDSADQMIKEIAETVGYVDYHYFSRVFKTVTGISPSEYRKQNGSH